MKKKIISLMIAVLAAGAFVSCSDWTEPEARDFTQHKPASYYENLRAWKADKSHPIAFGWFGGWDPTGATTATSLMGIPDSVSLVANWATFSLTPEQMEEVVQVKKLKGTDVVVTILLTNVGAKATPEEVTAGVEDTWEQVQKHPFQQVQKRSGTRALLFTGKAGQKYVDPYKHKRKCT